MKFNPGRPHYSTDNLPMHTQEQYWDTINCLTNAATKKDETEITQATGVSRLPLCVASPAFIHPSFFPLNPFHLFYENCMVFLWDTMTSPTSTSEPIHFSKSAQLGVLIPPAMETLPSSFCGPIRDIHLKCNSQCKIYEWMAILHWYFIPIAIELSFNSVVLATLALFVEAIEFKMTVKPRNKNDLNLLHSLISRFLLNYKQLFIASDPSKIVRARLCIFQLIHVPIHIQWNGSIRLGSQATVERAIGEEAHNIRSKKAPFRNLTNIIYQRELFKILILVYPDLLESESPKPEPTSAPSTKLIQFHRIAWTKLASNANLTAEILAVSAHLGFNVVQWPPAGVEIQRWGKFKLANRNVLQSQLSKERSTLTRRSEWFEANSSPKMPRSGSNLLYGHVRAFYTVLTTGAEPVTLAVYTPLDNVKSICGFPRGSWATDSLGIWVGINTKEVYILRKHPGLAYLSTDERRFQEGDIEDNEEDNED
ncbi:hypothetical protein CPB83DRAFT_871593 [Crepidotus variabilis]|uniref:Uncharacterized protein n=1 Tax=Crepidotus variabilis TaxID=179855 RepID=A0A9P6E6R3_9AGAR|nr:hypothetical protein CPB83DRAFT_871593 [Crepidotus variabilis]